MVTKLGARQPPDEKSWKVHALSRQELIAGVHDNLHNLGLRCAGYVVNLRVGGIMAPTDGSILEPR